MPCRYAFPLESLTVNTWPDLPARIQTAMKFPAVLATLNAIDAVVVVPASWLARWASAIPGVAGRTEKFTALLAAPPTVTSTFPVVVPGGTGTTMLVALQLVGVPDVPLKVTVLVPCVVPKFAPAIVTDVPTAPDVGFKLVMLGADEVTVKLTPLLMSSAEPPPLGALVTTTFPVEAPLGTGTTMLVALQLVGVPTVPLKVTVLAPCVVPKFPPAIVTGVPTAPDVGFRLVMLGGGGVTTKFIPLLATPPTVTTTFPGVAPAGTGATMLVAPQLAGVAVTPLNFTVLVPGVVPKFAPLIVTDVPTTPDAGFRLVILGDEPPPALPALKAAKTTPQLSGAPRIALAATVPAAVCIRSSTISLVLGGAGTLASMANPLPAVKVAGFADKMAPSNNSPFHVVAAFALFGDALVPCPVAVASNELAVAMPEYSRIANLNVARIVSDTVIVFAPPLTFSAWKIPKVSPL